MKQRELAIFIENLLEQDEIYWAQRGRGSWLRRGDRNTGGWVGGNDNLCPLIRDYFGSLFTSSMGDIDPAVLNSIKPSVSNYMNDLLISDFTRDDVRKALFQIGDMKAPGPDGLHAIFFKRLASS